MCFISFHFPKGTEPSDHHFSYVLIFYFLHLNSLFSNLLSHLDGQILQELPEQYVGDLCF